MNPGSRLTFVVIPMVGAGALEACIATLQRTPASLVVVGRVAAPLAEAVRRAGGIAVESSEPVPRRRAIGAALVTTEWAAFCEDTCELGPAWHATFETVRHEARADAWSGPVEISPVLSPRCIALAALEYGEFGPARWERLAVGPGEAWRPMARLAGLSLLYRAAALAMPQAAEGLIETAVNARIVATGRTLGLHPGLAVRYVAEDRDSATIASRRSHGRIYGGGLAARLPLAQRALATAKCALLPMVLAARGIAGLPRSRRFDPRALCWLFAFALAWSVGEAVGICFGRGASLDAWR